MTNEIQRCTGNKQHGTYDKQEVLTKNKSELTINKKGDAYNSVELTINKNGCTKNNVVCGLNNVDIAKNKTELTINKKRCASNNVDSAKNNVAKEQSTAMKATCMGIPHPVLLHVQLQLITLS